MVHYILLYLSLSIHSAFGSNNFTTTEVKLQGNHFLTYKILLHATLIHMEFVTF